MEYQAIHLVVVHHVPNTAAAVCHVSKQKTVLLCGAECGPAIFVPVPRIDVLKKFFAHLSIIVVNFDPRLSTSFVLLVLVFGVLALEGYPESFCYCLLKSSEAFLKEVSVISSFIDTDIHATCKASLTS